MNLFYAIILGTIQGLTEFLPISSTAHLTLAGKFLGLLDEQSSEAWTAFIAVMQLGTLAAVIVYFFKDLVVMAAAVVSDVRNMLGEGRSGALSLESRLAMYLILGTIPIGVAGVFFSKAIHGVFTKSTLVIMSSLIILGLILWLAEKVAAHKRTMEELTWRDALVIGSAQALALIPGSSRSGTTITAALFLNITRSAAARFSFLLSVPAVLGSGVYELTKISGSVMHFGLLNLIVATLVSAVSGYAAIAWLLRYLSSHTTMAFVWYRIGLGALLGFMLAFDFIQR